MQELQTPLAFLFVLGVVVTVHEAGHLLVAKAVGIYCKTFSIGFGPKLLRRRFGETEYALSAIPFGGYVKMAGEGAAMDQVQDSGTGEEDFDLDADGDPIPRARWFSSKNVFQRMAVILAGPLMNLVLAVVVMTSQYWVSGVPIPDRDPFVGLVSEGSPAESVGIERNDRFVSVAGAEIETWDDFVAALNVEIEAERMPIKVGLERGDEQLTVAVTPELNDAGRHMIGVAQRRPPVVGRVRSGGPADEAGLKSGDRVTHVGGSEVFGAAEIADLVRDRIGDELELRWIRDGQDMSAMAVVQEFDRLPGDESDPVGTLYFDASLEMRSIGFPEALSLGWRMSWAFAEATLQGLATLVTTPDGYKNISGPVGIAEYAGEALRWGFDQLMRFIAFFSVNLFLLNLLPIPVLDGGHAVFLLYEMVLGRRPGERFQMVATQAGFLLLLLLMALVLTREVIQIVT